MLDNGMQDPNAGSQEMAQPSPETGEESVDMTEDMTDDDIAATLGYITTVAQQQIAPPGETVAEDENNEVSTETQPQEDMSAFKDEILGEISALREDIVSEDMKKEFSDTMTQLKDLLANEDDTNQDANINEKGEN